MTVKVKFDDHYYWLDVASQCDRVLILPEQHYFYLLRPGSLVSQWSTSDHLSLVHYNMVLFRQLAARGPERLPYVYNRGMKMFTNYLQLVLAEQARQPADAPSTGARPEKELLAEVAAFYQDQANFTNYYDPQNSIWPEKTSYPFVCETDASGALLPFAALRAILRTE
ncbi:MAG: hypothetical protein LBK56_06805 [Gracilibacteraceae bacterium]|nr:hypothetical protein [Gracilibacteraceae bacterium]